MHDELSKLLEEAAGLTQRASELVAQGDIEGAMSLEQEADRLRKQAKRRVARARTAAEQPARFEQRQMLRELALAGLDEIGVPSAPQTVARYIHARFGRMVDHRTLASMRRDERRTWSSPRSDRPVYIVPAIEGRRFLPARGKLALSNWDLERRLIGPWSERVDHLRATLSIADQLEWLKNSHPAESERLARLLEEYASTVHGVLLREPIDLGEVREATRAELRALRSKDQSWRAEATARARAQLDEEAQLWGASPPRLVGLEEGSG